MIPRSHLARKRHALCASDRGLTLVEVLVTTLLLAMVLAALVPLFSVGQQTWDQTRRRQEIVQNARMALDRIVREMRAAQSLAVISPTDLQFSVFYGVVEDTRGGRGISPSWWNSSWTYRQRITVTTRSAAASTGYALPLTVDHASLIAAGKSLANGDDVRVVYWNGTSWTELDRVLDDTSAWNTATTEIWFRTQAAIAANASSTNYYLYYGNTAAGAPPANPLNVFLFHDNFAGASVDTSKWTITQGTATVSGGVLTLNRRSSIWANPPYASATDTAWEARAQLSTSTARFFNYWGASDQVGYAGNYITFRTDNASHYAENGIPGTFTNTTFTANTPTSFHIYTFTREGTAGVRYFQDATQVAYLTTNVPSANLQVFVWNNTPNQTQQYNWVRVRPYVTPEPTTSFGDIVTVEYQLNSATNELQYRWAPDTLQPFAGPFRSMSVTCFDATNTTISCSSIASVRSVQVSLVAMDPEGQAPDITVTARAFVQYP